MRIARSAPQYVLLPTCNGERKESAPDAPARRAVSRDAVLGQPEHDDLVASGGIRDQSQTGATADAAHGPGGVGAAAQDDPYLVFLPYLAYCDPLRDDPRWPRLLERVRLVR